jgi:hypothetical protein
MIQFNNIIASFLVRTMRLGNTRIIGQRTKEEEAVDGYYF